MKKVWIGLSITCILIGILGTAVDLIEGNSLEDTAVVLFVLALFAAFFGWLAWLWRIKSPLKRAGEQAAMTANKVKESNDAYKGLSKSLKWRVWKYRIVGALIAVLGVRMWPMGNWSTFWISFGTVVLIIGIAIFMMGSPQDYNSITDAVKMIGLDKERTIGEFYEAYKEIQTPLGSAWLGYFYTSPYKSMIFGPDDRGQFIYFYLNSAGNIGYIGYSFLDNAIKKKLTESVYPPVTDLGADTAGHLCYHTDVFFFQDWLKASIENYVKTEQVIPFMDASPSEVYTFTEDFKLTGEHFEVQDKDQNTVYIVDGTMPLINLYIHDTEGNEIFKMTKEIGHALATYRFFYRGEPYGVLEKQFTFVRDTFTMDINEGRLELTEYAGTIGHNYKVTLNGTLIGAIMDDMDITIENIVWDNAFLIVHDRKYLPLITAMAVMVTRELARDEDGGLTNR